MNQIVKMFGDPPTMFADLLRLLCGKRRRPQYNKPPHISNETTREHDILAEVFDYLEENPSQHYMSLIPHPSNIVKEVDLPRDHKEVLLKFMGENQVSDLNGEGLVLSYLNRPTSKTSDGLYGVHGE